MISIASSCMLWLLSQGVLAHAAAQRGLYSRGQNLSANNTNYPLQGCAAACYELSASLPAAVFYPNSSTYAYQESNYWSNNQLAVQPFCRVAPSQAEDVSVAVKVLVQHQCQFAVKSGAHAAFEGASNIANGVTIDLLNLNQIIIANDHTQVSVGAGNRWWQVYFELDKVNLGVVGGRVADIGVGGLTLGGGISYFSGRYGFACDNVNNYEVVFADGSINNVNLTSFPDLYYALRGGGNNFGIVTRFDLAAFYQGQMWGGSLLFTPDKLPALIDAFTNFNLNHENDPYAALIGGYIWYQAQGTFIGYSDLMYGISRSNPPILQNITSIPTISSTLRISNLTDFTIEMNASTPSGLRQSYWTFTTHNSASLINDMTSIFAQEVDPVKNVTAIVPSLTFQPISTAITGYSSKNGGNALGLTEADGPLVLFLLSISWFSESDDESIYNFARQFVNRSIATATAQGLDHPFIYQNYAAQEQNVFLGYGEQNQQKLRDISQKYDPDQVFRKLQPGYFKL